MSKNALLDKIVYFMEVVFKHDIVTQEGEDLNYRIVVVLKKWEHQCSTLGLPTQSFEELYNKLKREYIKIPDKINFVNEVYRSQLGLNDEINREKKGKLKIAFENELVERIKTVKYNPQLGSKQESQLKSSEQSHMGVESNIQPKNQKDPHHDHEASKDQ